MKSRIASFLSALFFLYLILLYTGCTKESDVKKDTIAPGKFNIVVSDTVPPSKELKILSLNTPEQVTAAQKFEIRVTSNGSPVPETKIMWNNAEVLTDASGSAVLTAPPVEFPSSYHLSIEKEGFVYYIRDTITVRNRMLGEYRDGVDISVFPVNYISILPPVILGSIILDQPMGGLTKIKFDDLIEQGKKAGYTGRVNDGATIDSILGHLRRQNGTDIWIFFGHSNDSNSDGTVDGLTGYNNEGTLNKITKPRIDSALKSDTAPGFVFLGGCKTSDLLNNFVGTCVKVALGFDQTLPLGLAATVLKEVMSALFEGKTLDEAIDIGNKRLEKTDGKLIGNKNKARLKFKAKDWLKEPGKKTLREILDAKAP